ncbi:response regulator [Roseococcus sp. SDR]|uniref:response regulator n=1 Tax=Roseococcus sp. SDR TaxID=2835532 RepID=UPI001BCDE99C|nr:response regulator [Roseococcus sp. SDR]MBS7789455.1 response regulator [Roseococcus sp. SDR]MBV1844769.1 response regulator [Roseococcus sp. SDR]
MTYGRPLRIGIAICGVLLLLTQALAVGALLDASRRTAMESATGLTERAGHAVRDAINRTLFPVDAMLASLPALLAPVLGNPAASAAERELEGVNSQLRHLNSQNFAVRDILLVDGAGRTVAAALPASRRRPLVAPIGPGYVSAGLSAGGLLVSEPVRNPATGEWSVFFARPMQLPGLGNVHGVAEVQVQMLANLMAPGIETPGLRIWLERAGGTILAATAQNHGLRLQPGPAENMGPAIHPSRMDGRDVIGTSWQTLYPALRLTTEMEVDAALSAWRVNRDRTVLISAVFALLTIALMIALIVWLTQRDRAEADRVAWRRQLEDALDSMTDGFVMFDATDRLVVSNRSYRDMYRISAPFIRPGAHFDDIIREGARRGQYPQLQGEPTDAAIEAFLQDLKLRRRRGELQQFERLLPDGRWLLLTERPIPDGGVVGIRTDITELKRAMAELSVARDMAQRASAAKGMFLARMSHELRTPLNAVLGFAELLLQNADLGTGQREQLGLVYNAAAHLRDVVNTLLDLSKAEARSLDMKPRATALRPLAEVCAALVAPEVERRRIALAVDVDAALPATVLVDPLCLRQILLNLLSNAVKFTPAAGRVVMRLSQSRPGWVRIEVEDSGSGIPEEKRTLLFRDFSQIGAPVEPGAPSTGLGLAISAQLVAAMNGQIGCDSAPVRGALFWVELPMPAMSEPEVAEAVPAPEPPAPPEPETARPLRLLVADDILVNRSLARVMLEKAGHVVDLVADGMAAVEAVQRTAYDVVLMDVQMPGMDGLEATRRIRALEGPAGQVVIIALSASAMVDQVQSCLDAGMDGHLAKPINRAQLLEKLADVTRRRGGPPEVPAEVLAQGAARLRARMGAAAEPVIRGLMQEIRTGLEVVPEHAARGDMTNLAAAARRLAPVLRELDADAAAEATMRLGHAATNGGELSGALADWQQITAGLARELRETDHAVMEEGHAPGGR